MILVLIVKLKHFSRKCQGGTVCLLLACGHVCEHYFDYVNWWEKICSQRVATFPRRRTLNCGRVSKVSQAPFLIIKALINLSAFDCGCDQCLTILPQVMDCNVELWAKINPFPHNLYLLEYFIRTSWNKRCHQRPIQLWCKNKGKNVPSKWN